MTAIDPKFIPSSTVSEEEKAWRSLSSSAAANDLAELDRIADQLECGDLYQPADELRKIRTRIAALVEAAKLARRRFSDQNGKVSAEVWNENYDAVHALDEALRGVGQ